MRIILLVSVTAVLNSFTSSAQKASVDANEFSIAPINDEWIGFEKDEGPGSKGVLTSFNHHGRLQVVANYRHKRLHGSWISWYDSGKACDSGSLINNIPHGEWKTWYPNGQLRAIRNYNSKKLSYIKNELRLMHPKRSFYGLTEIARNDKGEAFSYFDAFNSFSEHHSTKTWEAPTLKRRVDINTDVNNEQYQPPFVECLQDGLFMNFDSDGGVIDSGYYKNGLKDGIWIEWSEDRSIRSTGVYRNGIKQDIWKYFNKEGKFLYNRNFRKQ
jgi:antitoxin component YwqK of YwqJK toxin-antitoxin module